MAETISSTRENQGDIERKILRFSALQFKKMAYGEQIGYRFYRVISDELLAEATFPGDFIPEHIDASLTLYERALANNVGLSTEDIAHVIVDRDEAFALWQRTGDV